MTPFLAFDSQMRLALNEAALNKLIFRDDGEPEDRCIVMNVVNEIISICRFMIDGFVDLISRNVMVPKYVYVPVGTCRCGSSKDRSDSTGVE
jgi:hypothetical protein